jgi:hypothetical protein
MDTFLKALSIFQIISTLVENLVSNLAPAKKEAVAFANKEIDGLITSGRLPADFRKDIGTLVEDVASIHPGVQN